jgi:hypothetical protein
LNSHPPTFERRFVTSLTNDPDLLIALATDESYFVRRKAVDNPNTPEWILDLLTRAGTTPDLRGKSQFDPDLDQPSLQFLAESGPWGCLLATEHPNTSTEVLAALKDQPSVPLRLSIARHPNAGAATLATLWCDIDEVVRSEALAHTNCRPDLIALLMAAGSTPDLGGVTRLPAG